MAEDGRTQTGTGDQELREQLIREIDEARVLPLCVSRVFTIAMADPSNQLAIDEISARTGFLVQPVLASDAALDQALDRYYGPPGSSGGMVRPGARRDLRLVWSRKDSPSKRPQEGPGGEGSDGGRSAA